MSFINKLLDLDFGALLPAAETLLFLAQLGISLAVIAGPLVMVVLGLLYLFRPTKEANYKFGFRTYFGMGSEEAWRFTQKMAGLLFSVVGGVLLLIMLVIATNFIKQDLFAAAGTALVCLCWQLGVVLVIWFTVALLAGIYFDKDGGRRRAPSTRRVRRKKEKPEKELIEEEYIGIEFEDFPVQ